MKAELTLEEVDSNIKHLKSFIYDISICISNIEQIIKSQEEGLFLEPIEGFVGHYVYIAYSNCTINSYKIFKQGESWSVPKLCNKVKNSRFDKELRDLLILNKEKDLISSKHQLLVEVSKIETEIQKKSKVIEKINKRRLKFYAHSDRDSGSVQPETLNDLKEIRDLAISIFHILNEGLHGVYFMFDINIASIDPVLTDRKIVDDLVISKQSEQK